MKEIVMVFEDPLRTVEISLETSGETIKPAKVIGLDKIVVISS